MMQMATEMLNFTVGPVTGAEDILAIGAEQVPYFRTPEFSHMMLENERMVLELAGAPAGSRAVFLTGSGTASMEASVASLLGDTDRALVVDGGSFGHRFVEICQIHGIEHEVVVPRVGCSITLEDLEVHAGHGCTALLIQVDETSTGVLHNMDVVGEFCREQGMLLIADAVSAFLADPVDMAAWGVDALLTGSQKALACPPGVSIVMLSPRGVERAMAGSSGMMYLDLASALVNGERGQTPFTCAVGTLRQIHARLAGIVEAGGAQVEVERCAALAADFRQKIAAFPFEISSESLPNGVTPLHTPKNNAMDIFATLKDEYGIWICPNGGAMAKSHFRVGHLGALTTKHNDALIAALESMRSRGLL